MSYSYEQLVSLIFQVGELMLTSGAEIYRVEETAERMGKAAGFEQVEVYATPTGIFITLITADGKVFTRVRRIRFTDNNLAKIAQINALSRQFASGEKNVIQVEVELRRLTVKEPMARGKMSLAGGIGSGAFALIFGGNLSESLFAGVIGLLVLFLFNSLSNWKAPRVLLAAIGASLAATLGLLGQSIFAFRPDITILGGVMILVPGVTMTIAIRDMLSGELVSGVARGAEALTIAVAVAAGVAVVLGFGGV